MPLYQGTHYTRTFILKDKSTGGPVDISGWGFRAQFRDNLKDDEEVLELTTDNGGFLVSDGPNGELVMEITATQSDLLPLGKVVFDVLRTEIEDGPVFLFGGRLPVKRTVTRD